MHLLDGWCRLYSGDFSRRALALSGLFIAGATATAGAADADSYVGNAPNVGTDAAVTGIYYFAASHVSFDDNLYRLPENANALQGTFAPNIHRSDRVVEEAVGVDGQWITERQILAVDVRVNHDQYAFNSALDNTNGVAHLFWDWNLGAHWSGQAGIDHEKGIASFANTRLFEKNLIDTSGYYTSGRYQVGPSWALTAEVRESDTRQSLFDNDSTDLHLTSGSFGTEYATSSTNTLALIYTYSSADYPFSSSSDFKESTTRFVLKYNPSDRTSLDANAGYLKRDYASGSDLASYSGQVWHANVHWQPGGKSEILASVGRDLSAYVEAETEYFIANQRTLTANWAPRNSLSLSLLLSWADENFLPTPAYLMEDVAHRRDTLKSQKLTGVYKPRAWLSFNFAIALQQRDSNNPLYPFRDRNSTIGFKITL